MRSITRLFAAVGTLADSLLSLACVVNSATDKLRDQLAGESEPAALVHHGRVITAPVDDDGDREPAPTKRNGRASKAAP